MPRLIDSYHDCKLLHSNITKDESSIVLLHAKLNAIAKNLDVADVKRENMLLVAAELASNNVKHAAGRGQIQIWLQPGPVLDIVSLDYGPGIVNLSLAERDGYSTSNTFGKGLGAIRRLSDESYFYTQPQTGGRQVKWSGTAFVARFHLGKLILHHQSIGIFSRALSDTPLNGDRIYLLSRPDKLRWLHLDGIGHGEEAHRAGTSMDGHVLHNDQLLEMLSGIDKQLVNTRGAVAAIGEIDLHRSNMQLTGVGDMHAHLYQAGEMQNFGFASGILGREHRTPQLMQSSLSKGSVLITASDGIRRNWDAHYFNGIFEQHPQLAAYVIGNIMGRGSDDQSIFITTIK